MASVRGIPRLYVSYVENMKARTHNEINTWDNMISVFSNYAANANGPEFLDKTGDGVRKSDNEKKEGLPLVTRRLWAVNTSTTKSVSSLICLGPYMICRPRVVTDRPTRLVSDEEQITYLGGPSSDPEIFFFRTGFFTRSKITTADKKYGTSWRHIDKEKEAQVKETQTQGTPEQRIQFHPVPTEVWTYLRSVFRLRHNQPFGIKVRFFEIEKVNAEVQKAMKDNWDKVDAGKPASLWLKELADLIPKESRMKSVLAVRFGSRQEYALLFYENRSVCLFRKSKSKDPKGRSWQTVGEPQTIKTTGYTIVYPIGSAIYLFGEDEIPMKPGRIPAACFQLEELVDTGESYLTVYMYGGSVEFAFAPVTHAAKTGSIEVAMTSPQVEIPFQPKGRVVQCVWVGKRGCEAYPTKPGTGGIPTVRIPKDHKASKLDTALQYLKDTEIKIELIEKKYNAAGNEITNADPPVKYKVQYFVALTPSGSDKDNDDRIYSPGVAVVGLTYVPADANIYMPGKPAISGSDITRVSVTLGVESSSAEITLNNRQTRNAKNPTIDPPLGNYTPGEDRPSSVGMKPIRISAAVSKPTDPRSGNFEGAAKAKDERQIFYGYINRRSYHRSSPGNISTVTFSAVDRMIQTRETYCFNVPILDGMCHLAAFYLLAKEAGFADDDICLWQDPYARAGDENKPSHKLRLIDVIDENSGGPGSAGRRDKGCWAGHVKNFPGSRNVGPEVIAGDRLHMTLPMSHLLGEAPFFDFKTGVGVYEAMQKIRQHSFFYLYANHFGSLVYCPPESLIRSYPGADEMPDDAGAFSKGRAFVEVDRFGKFNEFQRAVDAVDDMSEIRDGVYVVGVVMMRDSNGFPVWQPFVSTKAVDNWPNNYDQPNFRPYRRFILYKNPKLNDPKRADVVADRMFLRHSRRRLGLTLGAWGDPSFFPYELFLCDERHANELGIDGTEAGSKQFIMAQVKHDFSADGTPGLTWWTQIVGEQLYLDDPYAGPGVIVVSYPKVGGVSNPVSFDNTAGRP